MKKISSSILKKTQITPVNQTSERVEPKTESPVTSKNNDSSRAEVNITMTQLTQKQGTSKNQIPKAGDVKKADDVYQLKCFIYSE